jgi:YbbR domain-containing protein
VINRLLENWFYKFMALVVAVSLWAFVTGERIPVINRTVQLPLNIYKDKGYTVTSAPDDVAVSLSGPKTEVDKLKPSHLQAWVDLQGRGAGTHRVQVNVGAKDKSQVPNDVQINVNQMSYKLTLESISSRSLPVEVHFVSLPPVGYTYGEPQVVPATSSVSGRSSVIDSVRRLIVSVDPSSAPDLDVDRSYTVTALDAGGNEVKGIEIKPARVQVRLDAVAVPARKSVLVSPSVVGQPQYPYKVTKVTVRPEAVIVEGKPAALFDISTIGTDDVSIDGATGTVEKDVKLRVLPGIGVEGAKTVRVRVNIESRQE